MDICQPTEADVIIAGGGTAACTLAASLLEADPDLEVLIIEAGPNNRDKPTIRTPSIFVANLATDSGFGKYYLSRATRETANRAVPVLSAAVLGGGSSINFMMYARPMAHDFDEWNTEGWRARDMIPLLNKIENYCEGDSSVNKGAHGTMGKFQVSIGGGFRHHSHISRDVLQAGRLAGIKLVEDIQDGYTAHGISSIASWIDPKSGLRQDAAHVLIHPILDSGTAKLKVITEHQVVRVLFNANKLATGVEVVSKADHNSFTIRAKKQVVISAGAFGTPQILERSGIGRKEHLATLKVPLIADVPGVGAQYLDHQFFLSSYKSLATEEESLDGLWNGRQAPAELTSHDNGIMGWTSMTMIGKLRPTVSEVKAMGPEFEILYERDFMRNEKPLGLTAACNSLLGDHIGKAPAGQYFTMAVGVAYGYSKGSIHASGTSVNDVPDFRAGFLSAEADVKILVWQYKKTREIARRMLNYDGPYEPTHPTFSSSSKASFAADMDLVRAAGSERSTLKDILYSKEDDLAIEKFVRGIVNTMWHSAGTCPMKPLREGGVVDKELGVHGVSGLKVADMSIVPSMVASNTYSTALVIGEKASGFVIKAIAA